MSLEPEAREESPEIIVTLQTEFLFQRFSQNWLYYLLSAFSYVSYT